MNVNDPLIRVPVEHGGADEFWDAFFTPLQRSYAEVEVDEMRSISVHLDMESGTVSLNAGYIPDSPEGRSETNLFENFEDAIVESLARRVSGPTMQTFIDAAARDVETRHDSLDRLLEAMASHELDQEDADA